MFIFIQMCDRIIVVVSWEKSIISKIQIQKRKKGFLQCFKTGRLNITVLTREELNKTQTHSYFSDGVSQPVFT